VSFVNAISTSRGGTHVNYILDQIVSKLIEFLSKKKTVQIKPFQVKAHLNLFINCLIENPCFTSQTKETLTTTASSFGSTCLISDEFIRELMKTGIGERIINFAKLKEHSKIERELKKAKKNRLMIPKLEDAN
jgi:DNA topoisomerase II